MNRLRFIVRMAWREARGEGARRLWLLSAAIIAGVSALVAINSFTENMRRSVVEQARALLGADLTFRSTRAFPEPVEALIDSLATRENRARVTSLIAMAYVPRTRGVRLVQVRAVEPGYPFYGEITTDPADLWRALPMSGGVLVDPVLLPALEARVGDTLAIGEARFPIVGQVLNVPGEIGVASAFGARVYLPATSLPATRLVQFGTRAEYEEFIRLAPAGNAVAIAKKYREPLREQRVGIRTVQQDQENVSQALTRLGNYLGLVALVALFLGGLGVASGVNVLIKRKLDTIAVLRCLGARAGSLLGIYLTLAVAMAGLGSLVGAAIGVGLQQLLPLLFRGLLPVDVQTSPSLGSILLGTGLGLWVAGMFAALPLLAIRRISPLRTLRRDVDPLPARSRTARTARLLIGLSVAGLSVLQVGNLVHGIAFAAATGIALLLLWLAAKGLIAGVRRWFPHRWPYLLRQGLANLYRPANQTVMVVLGLGFGAFILTTLFVVQGNLLREFRPGLRGVRPNLMLFDIQPVQAAGVGAVIEENRLELYPMVPIVTMRIKAIRGVPLKELLPPPDTGGPTGRRADGQTGRRTSPAGWALRREYRSTYRDTLTAGERVVHGKWWNGTATGEGPVLISVEKDVADELTLKVGDEITWDVQGTDLVSRVASLRTVEWRRFEPNFFVVFQSGALEKSPQTLVTLTRSDSAAVRGRVQRQLAERFPNVTILDLSQIREALESVLDRGALIVRFLALFSLVTGAIVLVGSVSASRMARIREAVLLKTLGATRRQVLKILIAEYTALGVLATLVSVGLASTGAWALFRWVFKTGFQLPVAQLGGLTVLLIGITLGIGLWNSAEILKRAPLAVLREE
jgi:putative ABC transport system permease protein